MLNRYTIKCITVDYESASKKLNQLHNREKYFIFRFLSTFTNYIHSYFEMQKGKRSPLQIYPLSLLTLFITGTDTALPPLIQLFKNQSNSVWVLMANHTHRLHTAADFL